jgi:hypothetical protein
MGLEYRPLEHALQFVDIPRPRVVAQESQCLGFDFMNFTNEFAAEGPQMVLREQPQIVVPLPSR